MTGGTGRGSPGGARVPSCARPPGGTRFRAGPEAPALDFVITLCDQAAGESCPVWPGRPVTAHWPFPDPARAEGTDAERRAYVAEIYRGLQNRIEIFVELPLEALDRLTLARRVEAIGQMSQAPA